MRILQHLWFLFAVLILIQVGMGFQASLITLNQGDAAETSTLPDVLVLIATQSFTGEELVEDDLMDRLLSKGWKVQSKLVDETGIDWTEVSLQQQKDPDLNLQLYAKAVLAVASTYADGDPPNHANEFADWLARSSNNEGAMAPPFAVFGLGDSSYAHYCAFGEFIYAHLAGTKHAPRLIPLHTGDAQGDQSGSFAVWSDLVVAKLLEILPLEEGVHQASRGPVFSSTGADWRRSAVQPDSTTTTLIDRIKLLPEDASRSVVHVAIQLPHGIEVQPGDHAGIYPRNSVHVVDRAIAWLGIDATMTTTILERRDNGWSEVGISAREFFTAHVDLAGRATPSALRALLPFVGTLELRALARHLTFVETKAENTTNVVIAAAFEHWLAGRRLTKMDLAEIFECRPGLQGFARAIGPMQPRLYSIAMVDLSYHTLGLCISLAEGGLCSNYVANLPAGSSITMFFRQSRFHFFSDGTPSFLIGAGSGVGPYVGFLEHECQRRLGASATPLSHTRLFLGFRSPSDIIYEDRLSEFLGLGTYGHYAFSRIFGQPKVHAQDLVSKEARRIWHDVFENTGRIYVCGRLELCVDVKNALINVAIAEGGLSKNESHRLVDNLEQDGRLLTDCWSVDDPFRRKTINVQSSSHVIHRLERHHSSEASTGSCESTEVIDVSHVPEWPSYLRLVASGELQRHIEKATDMYSACVSCGRFCEVNRTSPDRDDWGECRVGTRAIVSAADAHFGEEASLKGTHGSGTIFFGACNLKCIYCQNWQLSAMDRGEVVTPERLAQLMLGLQERGCHNINFVSPTHNVLAILEATLIAAQNGLRLPIVWNTGGYDSVASLRLLEGVIDIYMPDAKYAARKVARKLSKIDNYPEINQAAIKEMYRQNCASTSDVAAFIAKEVGVNTFTHVMDYYRPEFQAATDTKFGINRHPTIRELKDAHRKARCANLERIYGEERNCFTPDGNENYCLCKTVNGGL